MIPALNMSSIHRHTGATVSMTGGVALNNNNSSSSGGGGGGGRATAGRQLSPRASYITSPREPTSSQPSAHLTRRAVDVAGLLEMNPLHCHSTADLQRKLIETAEYVVRLRYWYAHQLQERDVWYESRLRGLEEAARASTTTGATTTPAVAKASVPPTAGAAVNTAPCTIAASRGGSAVPLSASATAGAAATVNSDASLQRRSRTPKGAAAPATSSSDRGTHRAASGGDAVAAVRAGTPQRSAVVPVSQRRRAASAGAPRRQLLRHVESSALQAVHGIHNVEAASPILLDDSDDASAEARSSSPSSSPPPCEVRAGSSGGRHHHRPAAPPQVAGPPTTADAGRSSREGVSATTPLGSRPRSANAITTANAAQPPGRLSARAGGGGGGGDGSGGRRSEQQSARKRYYASPRIGLGSGGASSPPYARYLDPRAARDGVVADSASRSATQERPPHLSTYLYLLVSGTAADKGGHHPKRRSASSGVGVRHTNRMDTAGAVERSGASGGLPG